MRKVKICLQAEHRRIKHSTDQLKQREALLKRRTNF